MSRAGSSPLQRVLHRQLEPDKPRIGLANLAVMRVKPARQHGLMAAGDAVGHHHRLGAGGRPVIERGVGDFHPGQQRDLGLELEQILQCPLRDLRLVRRVGGQELAALDQMVDGRRDVMAVHPAADEERDRAGGDVSRRHARHQPLDLDLAHRPGEIDRPGETRRLGHVVEQSIDRIDPDGGQHLRPIARGERQVAHQCCSSTNR